MGLSGNARADGILEPGALNLLLNANVLIDYWKADARILSLLSTHLGMRSRPVDYG